MKLRAASDQDFIRGRPLRTDESTRAEGRSPYLHTTPAERLLLFTTAVILPLESHIRQVPNFSIAFLMFAALAGYTAINRLRSLDRVWMHPVFVAAYVFIGISVAAEFSNPLSDFHAIGRFAQMIIGALLVASLCRDRLALKMLLYGYIGAALWLGALLFLASYGKLSGVVVLDAHDASLARAEAFRDSPIEGNLNQLAFSCVQGAVVALAFALGSASVARRNIFAILGVFCLVASTLPMSRQAIVIDLVACTVMLKAFGVRQGKVWLLAALIAASAVFIVPDAVWLRMTVDVAGDKRDVRVSYYENAKKDFGDYWLMGVGSGNYFQKWGFDKGYAHGNVDAKGNTTMVVYGVHNGYLQVLIFWGVIGLSAFLTIIWKAYRCAPERYGGDPLVLALLGVAVSLLLLPFFTHNFENKVFSLGLGMLVAYRRWMVPDECKK